MEDFWCNNSIVGDECAERRKDMTTYQAILTDVDLRYRNTYTTLQKLVWLNEEQRELFDVLEIDSPPYAFTTVLGINVYPFPSEFDVTKIKVVSYQIDVATTPNFVEVEFKRNDDHQVSDSSVWYTIVSDSMFLYVPSSVPADRTVYIYCDSDPTEVTTANISSSPDLPRKYQEILKLGVLKRIAGARKDIQMRNNYDAEYQQKLDDILWQKKLAEPEWVSPSDVLPKAGSGWHYGKVASFATTE